MSDEDKSGHLSGSDKESEGGLPRTSAKDSGDVEEVEEGSSNKEAHMVAKYPRFWVEIHRLRLRYFLGSLNASNTSVLVH